MTVFLSPCRKFGICAAPKCASTSSRRWMFERFYGRRFCRKEWGQTVYDFWKQEGLQLGHDEAKQAGVELLVAIHRDPAQRLMSIYQHVVAQLRRAPDQGVAHFVKNLEELREYHQPVRHHATPQYSWLGLNPKHFDIILPLASFHLLPGIINSFDGKASPP